MKKYILYILILLTFIGFTAPVYAETKPNEYKLLAPLPCPPGTPPADCPNGELRTFDPGTKAEDNTALGRYLNLMIKLFIGLCAVLSVVMIVVGGIEVMTSELAHTKEAGKERISHAILGLLIALGAYALLYTVNPDLLKSDINIPSTNTGHCSITPLVTEDTCKSNGGTWTVNKK